MSCFWDAILNKIPFFRKNGIDNSVKLLKYLKENNKITCHVTWQNENLTNKLLIQNFKDIESYSETTKDGHLTSSCDVFLLLICELFCLDIEFCFVNTTIVYKNILNKTNKKIKFKSTRSHFT